MKAPHMCPIIGCKRERAGDHVMCAAHWFSVPMETRRSVWQLWNNGHPRRGHREVVLGLVASMNEKIAQARANNARKGE
jgi:hypothetical protein